MHSAGIDAFIIESRPFPDFLGPRWWATLDIIIAESKECGMKMWVFDDKQYPTGFANGAIKDHFPHLRKQFLRHHFIEVPPAKTQAWLDLGELYEIVEVRLNDKEFGACICPPYRFEITGCLKPGRNEIRIDVTNTLAKALGDNGLDRAMPQDPSGLFGPVLVKF